MADGDLPLLLRPKRRPPNSTHPPCTRLLHFYEHLARAASTSLGHDRVRLTRMLAWEALSLDREGWTAAALECATEIVRVSPHSTPALNLVASLHTHAATAAWEERGPGDDEAASASVVRHRRAAVDACAAAARIAPRCAMTGGMHAEALANDHRFPEAMRELNRVLSLPSSVLDDPSAHHIVYDMIDSSAKARKRDAVDKARAHMVRLAERINNEIVPREAARMLSPGADADRLQLLGDAKLLAEDFPHSSRAHVCRVYVELDQGRALDEPMRRKAILLRVLALLSDAAAIFDSSLLIALVHAKVLFALDRFDETETECRRALSVQDPTDPCLDDIPPAVCVPGADCDARVSYLTKQISALNTQIIVVAARCWTSIQTSDRVDRVISVRVDTLHNHYNGIDKGAAKTISDAVRFRRSQNSWSFFICPHSSCDGKKFVDTHSLWDHIGRHHRKHEHWSKLQSALGSVQNESATKDDPSLDRITLSQDSEQHDIFNLPGVLDMFESLLRSPSIGIQAEPLVEMQRRKCREGAEILECIKKKLRMLPKNKLSTEFKELCLAINNIWLKLLETSALDLREAILPLARSFQWIEMKRLIALSARDLAGVIGYLDIDAIFCEVHVPNGVDKILMNIAARIAHLEQDNKGLEPSCLAERLEAVEICEPSWRINVPRPRMISLDAEAYYRLGVKISNIGSLLTQLNNGFDEVTRYISEALPYLETCGSLLGDGLSGLFVRRCIGSLKFICQHKGTTTSALAFGARMCLQAGFHLQRHHPFAQIGGGATGLSLREIITIRTYEEACEAINEWKMTPSLVLIDVDEHVGFDEAKRIWTKFEMEGAYELIKDSSVLSRKIQPSDDTDWFLL